MLAWGQPPHGPGSPDHEMLPEPWQIPLVLSVVEQRGRSCSQGDRRRKGPPLVAAVRVRLPAPPSEELSHLAHCFPRQLFPGRQRCSACGPGCRPETGRKTKKHVTVFSSFFFYKTSFFFFFELWIGSRFGQRFRSFLFYLRRGSPFPGATALYWLLQPFGTLSEWNKKLFVSIFHYIYIYLAGLGRVFGGQRTFRGFCADQAWRAGMLWELIPSSPFPSLSLFLFHFIRAGAHHRAHVLFFFGEDFRIPRKNPFPLRVPSRGGFPVRKSFHKALRGSVARGCGAF